MYQSKRDEDPGPTKYVNVPNPDNLSQFIVKSEQVAVMCLFHF